MRAAVLDGLVLGLQYGLLGVGLTLVYGLTGVLNLAHGQIAVLGAIVVSLLMEGGNEVVVAALVGIVAAAALMVGLDQTLMRAVYRQVGERRILLQLFQTGLVATQEILARIIADIGHVPGHEGRQHVHTDIGQGAAQQRKRRARWDR